MKLSGHRGGTGVRRTMIVRLRSADTSLPDSDHGLDLF